MKKGLRYILRTLAVLLGIVVLAWIGVAAYVLIKKPMLLEKARATLKSTIGPASTLGDIDVSFFSHFPNVALQVSEVALRDSLWTVHHHDLLKVDRADVTLALFKTLASWKIQLGKVYLEHGSLYLFTDSTGYSNISALGKRSDDSSKNSGSGEMRPPDVVMNDMQVVVDKQDKGKLFDLDVRRAVCRFDQDGRSLTINLNTDILVKNFIFRSDKGSFIKGKRLTGKIRVVYNTGSKIVQFNKTRMNIDGHPFVFSGRFFPAVSPDPFFLQIETNDILWKNATALLTPALQQKLDLYAIDHPVSVLAVLDAGNADIPKPLITVKMNVHNNSINTPIGRFEDVSFMASFSNEQVRGLPREDENSVIRLLAFTGTLQSLPLKADTVTISNLNKPILRCDLHSRFPLSQLNDIAGSSSLEFGKGSASLDIQYRGPLSENDTASIALYGGLDIDSGAISYVPYHFDMTDCKGRIRFNDQDIRIERLEARTANSKIVIKGIAKNAATLLDQTPQNVMIDLALTSPSLDLEDMSMLAGKASEPTARKKNDKNLFGAPASRLDMMLRDGKIHMQLEAADLHYKKFKGAHAKADLLFAGNSIRLDQLALEQGSGRLTCSGELIRHPGIGNPLRFRSHLEGVDLPAMFTAFDNFGQNAIHDKNLKGRLTADIQMTGRLTDKAKLAPNSLLGTVDFSIKGGQLIDFEPMQKIHETVLKNRDLSEIHFAELGSQLDLDTSTIKVHRMEIQSTAFTVFAEGIYDMKTGADMSLTVPLSNLKKERSAAIPPANKGNDGKAGIAIRLRAKTGEDGKLKISWDPFRKALKKMKGK